jgi:hypothetical protein
MLRLKLIALGLICTLIVACASTFQGGVARTREAAIQLAKKACGWTPQTTVSYERWRVQLHDGARHVWLTEDPGDAAEPRCCDYNGSASMDVWIQADSEKSNGCGVFVDEAITHL